jgi:tripartite-type tricarboxylate transporter receptor subunit TctC
MTAEREVGTKRKSQWTYAISMSAMVAVTGVTAAQAQDAACEFYKDKTVELVVANTPGSGFDAYGRLVAKYMGPELGVANMIVRNEPGAGGMLGTNKTWAAEPDGLRIQIISANGSILADLVDAEGVEFKINEFSWIGRVAGDPDILLVAPPNNINTIEDVEKIGKERKVRIGSSGPGDIDYIEVMMLGKMFGWDIDIITGFGSANEIFPLLARGEVDMLPMSLSSGGAAERSQSAHIRWSFGTEQIPERTDVKPISEFVDAKFLPILKVHEEMVKTGRGFVAPPGVPEDRLKCLRDAFSRATANKDFVAESVQINRPVAILNGEEMAELVKSATNPPKEYLDLVLESFATK